MVLTHSFAYAKQKYSIRESIKDSIWDYIDSPYDILLSDEEKNDREINEKTRSPDTKSETRATW